MCNCSQNQTHKDTFEFAKKNQINLIKDKHLGIGLFLIPAPENGILEYKTVQVENISYRDCVKRGKNCNAYQWIPFGIQISNGQNESTINSLKDFNSIDLGCEDTCKGGCPLNGCFCWAGEALCHR